MSRITLSWALLGILFLGFPALAVASSAGAFTSLFAVEWLDDAYHEFQLLVTTRKGMMIFSVLGVSLALWVIWYRRN